MSNLIQARILKGFRDLLPQAALPRQQMIDHIRAVFSSFGYVPIETPALEYAEILLGKGSQETDKQMFRFRDQGDRDVALRFDLTVPLARFIAMHGQSLGSPFRRYHIAPVWRAEKPQRGRYREFTQCDFDIIGSHAATSDAEIVHLIVSIFDALSIPVCIRINHRQLLAGILSICGAQGKETTVLRAIDKLDKLGAETVRKELTEEGGLSASEIERLFSMLALSNKEVRAAETLSLLAKELKDSEVGLTGVRRLQEVFAMLQDAEAEVDVVLDLRIARGLDYYTGIVFETQCRDLPDIGSICSGGRYDNLTGLYTKQAAPGVGASVGLDRTLAALEELGRISTRSSCAAALIARLDEQCDGKRMALANTLRNAGVSVEVYPEKSKLGAQIKYADRRGIEALVFAGETEFTKDRYSVKFLKSGEQIDDIALAELAETILRQGATPA